MLRHDRRHVVHSNITAHPTAEWAAQQTVEAFPEDQPPRFLIRDRDPIYSEYCRRPVKSMGIEEVLIAPRSPWQNPYAERFVRTIKESCLDREIFFGEDPLRTAINEFVTYYHYDRNRQGFGNRLIDPREEIGTTDGPVACRERLGG